MARHTVLKFSEFIDLVLARLYGLEQDAGPGVLFDVNAIRRELAADVPSQWVFDAGKVLESRGLAQVAFTFGGGCHARLTGEGRLFVEEERGTGIIRQYRTSPADFVSVSGTGNQVTVGRDTGRVSQTMAMEREREPAFLVLRHLKEALGRDATLTEAERTDLLTDVEMIEQQLRKREPNRPALAALLEPLSRVTSIAGLVADLVRLFNP
jgi:hypothetical protein